MSRKDNDIINRWMRANLVRRDDGARRTSDREPLVKTGEGQELSIVFPASVRCGGGRRIIRKKPRQLEGRQTMLLKGGIGLRDRLIRACKRLPWDKAHKIVIRWIKWVIRPEPNLKKE